MQREEKPITDYLLIDTIIANTVNKLMKIDKEKQYGLCKLEENTATNENKTKGYTQIMIQYKLILILTHQQKNKDQRR